MENILKPGEDPNDFGAGQEPQSAKPAAHAEAQAPKPEPTNGGVPAKTRTVAELLESAKVELDRQGLPMPRDAAGEYNIARVLYFGKAFPNWVKSTEQAFAVCQFLRGVGLQPMVGIQHTCEVNGRISLWGEGPMAAVMASGKLKAIEEYVINDKYERICVANKNLGDAMFAVVCRMERIDGRIVEHTFTKMDAASVEQGIPTIWKKWPRIMWKRKARAEVIKDLFADVIGGAGIAEYDMHRAPDLEAQLRPEGALTAKQKLEARYGEGLEVSAGSEANALPHMPARSAEDTDRSMPHQDVQGEPVGCVVQRNPDVPGAP